MEKVRVYPPAPSEMKTVEVTRCDEQIGNLKTQTRLKLEKLTFCVKTTKTFQKLNTLGVIPVSL
jgi:hypothetical protein